MRGLHFSGWEGFKAAVNLRYGLTKAELDTQFYALKPAAGEQTFAYIARVEEKRLQLGKPEGDCLAIFGTHFDRTFQAELERIKWSMN